MDVASMRKSIGEFLAVAEGGGFGPPPAGEWDEVAAGLTERELGGSLHVLIVSKDQLVVDTPRPLGSLLAGLCETHLPPHADQLRGLRG